MKFFWASDYSTCIVWPCLSIGEVRCANRNCDASHGYLVLFAFWFWAIGIHVFATPPEGHA